MIPWIKEANKKICGYEELDKAIKSERTNVAKDIDCFYKNESTVSNFLMNNNLFKRRSQLLNRLNRADSLKNVLTVIISSLLSALTTKVIDFSEFLTLIKAGMSEDLALFLLFIFFASIMFAIIGFIDSLFRNNESPINQMYRYELNYIDRILRTCIKENLSDGANS